MSRVPCHLLQPLLCLLHPTAADNLQDIHSSNSPFLQVLLIWQGLQLQPPSFLCWWLDEGSFIHAFIHSFIHSRAIQWWAFVILHYPLESTSETNSHRRLTQHGSNACNWKYELSALQIHPLFYIGDILWILLPRLVLRLSWLVRFSWAICYTKGE